VRAAHVDPVLTASLQAIDATEARLSFERAIGVRFAAEPKGHRSPAEIRIHALGVDPEGIEDGILAYRGNKLAAGDLVAAKITDPLVRTALEWVALRTGTQAIGLDRLTAFAAAHPDWPAATWLRHQMEARLIQARDPLVVERFFEERAPETIPGKLALAKALKATGRMADGVKLARAVFRESDMTPYLEGWLKAEFGADLTKGDYKYRADRLQYQARAGSALRYAAIAGPDVLALAKARAAAVTQSTIDAVPEPWRTDPGLLLGEIRQLRRSAKLIEAARLMVTVPRDRAHVIDGDVWWTERRTLARELLDAGKINAAYITCAMHAPASRDSDVDAEFHAGWIALRFMHDPTRATYHFWMAAKLAETPTSIARIAYWQGRTADASSDPGIKSTARAFYEKAAANGWTYYGQLARQTLGATTDLVEDPSVEAFGNDRVDAVRIVELLYAAGDEDDAEALAIEAAGSLIDPGQIAALAAVVVNRRDAHLALTIGKIVGQRGIPVTSLAFPTFGVPAYKALANSAPTAIVYSVARQESAFIPNAVSSAGAKGLMQMIASTARRTAAQARLPFDVGRLVRDASFNAQLGAAHLGALIAEHDGSLILTFAAYNAGGGRVQEWLKSYGDPRKPGIDPVDWVERIPFTETRNYVQRVVANVAVYTALFTDKAKPDLLVRATREARLLRRGG
jgi:soluble lytic murein transglycosylase